LVLLTSIAWQVSSASASRSASASELNRVIWDQTVSWTRDCAVTHRAGVR
jgi:hypothetical protein